VYIRQQQTVSISRSNHDPLVTDADQQPMNQSDSEYDGSSTSNVSQVTDKLSRQSMLSSTCVKSDFDVTAVNRVEVNAISDMEISSPGLQQCRERQTLPIDVVSAQHQPSKELLHQEADRLRRLCDSVSQHTVITSHASVVIS